MISLNNLKNWLLIGFGIVTTGLLIAIILIIKKNQTIKKLHTLSSFREMVWQEIAHTPIVLIKNVYKGLKKRGIETSLLKPLDKLYDFLQDLFDSIGKTKLGEQSDLEKEVRIAEKYIYCNNFSEGIPIQFKYPEYLPKKKVPPAIIVSTVMNAVKHAFNNDREIVNPQINISVEENKDGSYCCNILDNGDGFAPEIKSIEDIPESSTGLRRANNVLKIFSVAKRRKQCISIQDNPSLDWRTAVTLKIG